HFSSLREHTAFKLGALMLLARAFPSGTEIYLFGDDAERDPLIYSMFADICAGRLRGDRLIAVQQGLGVRPEYARDVATLADGLPARERVRGIHINLVREIDGSRIRECDRRVIGYPSAGAAARY